MIAALFVQRDGCYWDLPGVEPWDEARDARLYAGPWTVVAHPPCSRWCRLAGLIEHRYGHKKGDDGGCFGAALDAVRRWGGVLEHPAYTDAWGAFGLPRPPKRGWLRTACGGWVCHVEQGNYGHRARKATWLYAHGTDSPPPLIWGKAADSTAAISLGFHDSWRRRLVGEAHQMSKRQRSATPIEFRDLLISIAKSCRPLESQGSRCIPSPMTLPLTSFLCQCAQKCERCVSWLARAPEAQCYQDAETCECSCHAMAEELAKHRRIHVNPNDNRWNNHA